MHPRSSKSYRSFYRWCMIYSSFDTTKRSRRPILLFPFSLLSRRRWLEGSWGWGFCYLCESGMARVSKSDSFVGGTRVQVNWKRVEVFEWIVLIDQVLIYDLWMSCVQTYENTRLELTKGSIFSLVDGNIFTCG